MKALTEVLKMGTDRFYLKMKELIYPTWTPFLHEQNSILLWTAKLKDIPNSIDEIYRLRFVRFSKRTRIFRIFRPLIESLFVSKRFISLNEFKTLFKDKGGTSDFKSLVKRYPAYKLFGIGSIRAWNRFVNSRSNDLDGYFKLMEWKNPKLWNIFNTSYPVRLPDNKGKHWYVVGGTGSGKSELLKHLMIQDIEKGDKAIVVIEPNGDLSEQIARQQCLDKSRLVYIDCSQPGSSPSINPFDLINVDNELDIEKQSQVIRNALTQIFNWVGQPITLQMQSMLQPCMEIVAKQKGTLSDLQRFMVDGLNSDLVEAGIQSQKHGEFFKYKFNENNLLISRQWIYQKLMNLLNFSVFSDFFCAKSTIDIKEAIDSKKVILFNLSKWKLGEYASSYIGMMMVAIIQNIIFQRADIPVTERIPVRIYIDEFQDFVSESSEQIFVQGRKYHVGLAVASQIVGQKMTAEMTKIVLGNTDVKFIGVNGYQSLSVMSRETYTEIEKLNKLSVGRFFCKIFNGQSFVLEVPTDHLDSRTCIPANEREALLANQLNSFYAPRESLLVKQELPKAATGIKGLSAWHEVFTPKY